MYVWSTFISTAESKRRPPILPCGCPHCSTFSPECFSSLSAEALRHFRTLGTCTHRQPHETLFREGFPADHVFIVCRGRVKLVASSVEGRLFLLRVAVPGDLIGLAVILQHATYRVTAETLVPSVIKSIPGPDYLRFMDAYPEVSLGTSRAIARDYNCAVLAARRLALNTSAAGKLASTLLDWGRKTHLENAPTPANLPISFRMQLTHEELGNMAGLSRETVSRLLTRFRSEGLIRQTATRMTLNNPDQLETRYC